MSSLLHKELTNQAKYKEYKGWNLQDYNDWSLEDQAKFRKDLQNEAKFHTVNFAGMTGAKALPNVTYNLYTRYAPHEPKLVGKLMQNAYKRGLVSTDFVPLGAQRTNAGFVMGANKDNKLVKYIEAGKSVQHRAGVMAHEIGHAESIGKKVTDLYNKNKNATKAVSRFGRADRFSGLSGVATLINTLGHNYMSDTAMNTVAGVGAAGTLPTVAEEAKASWNGYKLLRKAGKGRLGAAMAFIGLPTYLAATALPFVPAITSKYVDKK